MQTQQSKSTPAGYLLGAALALTLVVSGLYMLRGNHLHNNSSPAAINVSEVVGLNLQLSNSNSPQERAASAQRLSEIAVQQINTKVTSTTGNNPAAIEDRLKQAMQKEEDPQARTSMASAIAKIHNRELMESTLNPLTQQFK